MKTRLATLLAAGLCAWCLVSSAQSDSGRAAAKPADQATAADEVSPLVTFSDTPLHDVVQGLARNAGINILFDPGVSSNMGTNTISVRFENVTAMQALEAVLANHGLMLQADPKTRISRIVAKPAVEPPVTIILRLKYANATNLVPIIANGMGTNSMRVFADPRTSQVVISAPESQLERLTNLIARLDTPIRQILIEANFIETSKNPKSLKGIDWSGTLTAQNFSFGNGNTAGTTTTTTPGAATEVTLPSGRTVSTTPGSDTTSTITSAFSSLPSQALGLTASTAKGFSPSTAFLNADGVKATLSFLNTDADSQTIATPRAVTLEGLETELSVVRNIPIFEQQQGQLGAAGNQLPNTVKPNYNLTIGQTILNEVGVKLVVTPRIVGDTNVALTLKPEISAQEAVPARVTLGGQVSESPIFSRRKLYTQSVIPSGSTLVLGGLISDETTKNFTKVPILGDIPLLGYAFRKDDKGRNRQNLLIFVTPTVIEETDFTPTETGRKFLRTNTDVKPEKDPSAWDDGKPFDWDKHGQP
ncbi:MAG TPA: secretin N-terminal domain-containing protein [Verrucomicrobiae bacterium]|nr:secretin N-terminal domain-containing protein [Verrucomicrobiae bacterium]